MSAESEQSESEKSPLVLSKEGITEGPTQRNATLVVYSWYTLCSACGRDADYSEKTHATLLGYGDDNGKPGCGATFTAIASGMYGDGFEEAAAACRPDLPYTGIGYAGRY